MDDLERQDWELIPDDEYQYHKYMEAETAEAEQKAIKDRMKDDEYIYHIM